MLSKISQLCKIPVLSPPLSSFPPKHDTFRQLEATFVRKAQRSQLYFLILMAKFQNTLKCCPSHAVREATAQTECEISLGGCSSPQPFKGLCLNSPDSTNAIKSLEWKDQVASRAGMEASKPCSDHPALQRGSNTRCRQDKRPLSYVTWPRETAFLERCRSHCAKGQCAL